MREQFLANFRLMNSPRLAVLAKQNQSCPPDDGEGDEHENELLAIHLAEDRLRFRKASDRPENATTAGIAAMLRTLAWNSRASVSLRRFFRTCFKSLLISASSF